MILLWLATGVLAKPSGVTPPVTEDLIHGGAAFLRPWRPDLEKEREKRGITQRQKEAAKLIEEAAGLSWQQSALDAAIRAFEEAEKEGEDEGIFFALTEVFDINSAAAIDWINRVRAQWLFRQNQNAIAILLL